MALSFIVTRVCVYLAAFELKLSSYGYYFLNSLTLAKILCPDYACCHSLGVNLSKLDKIMDLKENIKDL